MLAWALVVGLVNVALGFFTAAALADPPPWADWRWSWPRRRLRAGGAARTSPQPAAAQTMATPPPDGMPAAGIPQPAGDEPTLPGTIAGVEELPGPWLEQLAAAGIVAESFLEGAVQVLRLEIISYLEQLLAAEDRGRALATAGGAGLTPLAAELRNLNLDWLEKQRLAAQLLAQRSGRLGDHEAAAAELEQALVDQAAEICGISGNLDTFAAGGEPDGGKRRLLDQIAVLADRAHELRDRMLDLLATLLRTGQRLEVLGPASQLDPATGMPNRIGLEALLAGWWRGDPERSRPLSITLIDLDRVARLNQQLGTRAGDATIVAIGKMCEELIRAEGFERLARASGQAYLMVLGDTGPHQALATAERLRQTVEATTFAGQGVEFELTVSCGVIEAGPTDSVTTLLRRAGETAKHAKRAGRNRCVIDKGQGPQALEPPQFPVKGRVVSLGQ